MVFLRIFRYFYKYFNYFQIYVINILFKYFKNKSGAASHPRRLRLPSLDVSFSSRDTGDVRAWAYASCVQDADVGPDVGTLLTLFFSPP
jgi:hypothetical protein